MEELNWKTKKRQKDWDEMTFLFRETIIDELSRKFAKDPAFCKQVSDKMREDQDWWEEWQTWGIEIKGYLRSVFKDNQLPKGSWDYYWVSAIEKSVERVNEGKA